MGKSEDDWIDRLKDHLKKRGLRQQDLADRLEMTYQGVNHWFTRKRVPDTIEQFERIAKAAECSVSWMLFGVGPEEPITREDLALAKVIARLPPGAKKAASALLRSFAEPSDSDSQTGS